jgi:hypothetical protein
LELTALLEVPVQVTVEPSQQLAVEVDLVGRPWRAATSWACGWAVASGAGAKIAARAALASGSGEAARAGRAQNARIRTVTPKTVLLFISILL